MPTISRILFFEILLTLIILGVNHVFMDKPFLSLITPADVYLFVFFNWVVILARQETPCDILKSKT